MSADRVRFGTKDYGGCAIFYVAFAVTALIGGGIGFMLVRAAADRWDRNAIGFTAFIITVIIAVLAQAAQKRRGP